MNINRKININIMLKLNMYILYFLYDIITTTELFNNNFYLTVADNVILDMENNLLIHLYVFF